MKVNWTTSGASATQSGHQAKLDMNPNKLNYAEHFHIFVGDLAPEIDMQQLRDAFSAYGDITDVKIMKDPQTNAHKGYGFISFVNKVDAETAIASMNGQWLGTRKIRTNWATRKVQPGSGISNNNNDMTNGGGGGTTNGSLNRHSQKLDYNDVWNRSSDNNTTVYCGGINGITEDLIRQTFSPYGHILAIHPFPDRGYAFVRFINKESACNAICAINGMEINGCQAKCSWGKENIDLSNSAFNALAAVNNAAVAAAANVSLAQAQTPNNVWATAVQQNPNWAAAAAANYQWTAAGYATGPPPPNAAPNTMNYWQQFNTGYQNAAMMQGWGVMPTATATNASQFQQIGQNPQAFNAKS